MERGPKLTQEGTLTKLVRLFDDATTEIIGAAFDAVCRDTGNLTDAARLLIRKSHHGRGAGR